MRAISPKPIVQVQVRRCEDLILLPGNTTTGQQLGYESPSRDPRWLLALRDGLGHTPYLLEAKVGDAMVGRLPLSLVKSRLFGRFLVSLPYLNSAGVIASDALVAGALVDRAVALSDELDVRYLELRHEVEQTHPALAQQSTAKVHMRLALPPTSDRLWSSFKPKVRNQVRKGEKSKPTVEWGGADQLAAFYDVFSRNMRDLGTPVFGRGFFAAILRTFPGDAELCVVRLGKRPVAAALLTHGREVTEVPSASSLRAYNPQNVNMLMYWHLLQRAVERGQTTFDFGRSSRDSNTFRFKRQWGALPEAAIWQYYVRRGTIGDMRPENAKYQRMINTWRRLPLWLTRLAGPRIVRGIP